MEMFPNLEFGLFNRWILIVIFFVFYGIILIFFPKNAIARLYDRSDQRRYQILRRLFGLILVLLWLILVIWTPLKMGDVVFVTGISMFSLGLIGFAIALENFKNTPVDQPVTSGLYRISRHPQQLAVSISFLASFQAYGSNLGRS